MYIHPISRISMQTFNAQNNIKKDNNLKFDYDDEYSEELVERDRFEKEQNEIYQKGKQEMFNVAAYTIAAIMPICFFTYAGKADKLINKQNQIIEQKDNENAELRKKLFEKEAECDSLNFILENKKASLE